LTLNDNRNGFVLLLVEAEDPHVSSYITGHDAMIGALNVSLTAQR